ncbi:MAG: dihydrofolate reductase family protein, partial [Bacteroidota bacterium]
IDWLDTIPNPDHLDMGYYDFIEEIDALLMGRNTYEFVANYDGPWPYKRPVFVWSQTLDSIPEALKEKATLVRGSLSEVLATIHAKGYDRLYIDGGKTIQTFLQADLIDELIVTTIPVLLGQGIPLFGQLAERLWFEHVDTKVFLNQLVQNHYKRKR